MVIAICYTEKIAKLCHAGILQPLLDFKNSTKFQTIKLQKLINILYIWEVFKITSDVPSECFPLMLPVPY